MSEPGSGDGASDDLVARAIRELIDSVPGEEAPLPPDAEATTSQPWAETASPSAKNKRPLETLLADYAARVEAAPAAAARLPAESHPSATFFDRFATSPDRAGGRRRRRRPAGRRRRGGSGRSPQRG